MQRSSRTKITVVLVSAGILAASSIPLTAPAQAAPAQAAPVAVVDLTLPTSPELSEARRLADRRVVVTGDRAWVLGTADGRYPAAGFHTRGEMGGFWLPNLKLLDGMWFGIDDAWIGAGTKTSTGWGYVRTDLPDTNGVSVSRTDFVPDGVSGALVGLTLRSSTERRFTLKADAHSELLGSYPWGETNPAQTQANLKDSVAVRGRHLEFSDRGTPPISNGEFHDWGAVVGSSLAPTATKTGPNFRGPQGEGSIGESKRPVICPASGPTAPPQPDRCDDTEYGKGVGGQLRYRISLRPGEAKTIWFGVGGSANGVRGARSELRAALENPEQALRAKVATRYRVDEQTKINLPGNKLLADSIRWSKQMLAASEQRVSNLKLREVNAGQNYPPPTGRLDRMRWFGAGWPDYTWLFGTDGEYTAYAAVAAGQFAVIKDHLRALRDVSNVINPESGKIVHEVTPDGAVFFGADADAGNTDESSKYPTAVNLVYKWTGDRRFLRDLYPASVKAMKFVAGLDEDNDGWPEGLGNVEREGMGEEKLDNAVYTIRGYADVADMAQILGDGDTYRWAVGKARALLQKFEQDWWYGGDTDSYADSLDDPGNNKVFQRHWIGLTPTDAVVPRIPGRAAGPLASQAHANATLTEHELDCYSSDLGLYHTGTGPTSAPAGNPGSSCDSVISEVPSERNVFTLNSAIAAVSEGNYGRLGLNQQGIYTTGNARSQLDPDLWEMPGMMPEIVPGGDFGANIDRLFTERSMVMQAWGAYGTIWPVVHQWLGVSPDLGRGTVAVVPQIPADQPSATGKGIRLGSGSIDVSASRAGKTYTTTVIRDGRVGLRIGAVVASQAVASAKLNGKTVNLRDLRTVRTARGWEVTADLRPGQESSVLVITLR